MKEVSDEVKLIWNNKNKFSKFYDPRTLNLKECELSFKHYSFKSNIYRCLKPFIFSLNYKNKGIDIIETTMKSDTLTIYVNGICSTIEMALYQVSWLERLIGKPITLAYNYTDGFLIDLYECMQDRTRIKNSTTLASKKLAEYLKCNMECYEEINIIRFSQGCLITGRALELLIENNVGLNLNKINYTTFANPVKELDLPREISVEHFINKDDPIANIGIIEYSKSITGKKYYQNKGGHMLVADYIIPLCLDYFDKKSKFREKIIENERIEVINEISEAYMYLNNIS